MKKIQFSKLSKVLQAQIKKELAKTNPAFSHTDKVIDKLNVLRAELGKTFETDLRNYAKINLSLFDKPSEVDAFVKKHLLSLNDLDDAIRIFGTQDVLTVD